MNVTCMRCRNILHWPCIKANAISFSMAFYSTQSNTNQGKTNATSTRQLGLFLSYPIEASYLGGWKSCSLADSPLSVPNLANHYCWWRRGRNGTNAGTHDVDRTTPLALLYHLTSYYPLMTYDIACQRLHHKAQHRVASSGLIGWCWD